MINRSAAALLVIMRELGNDAGTVLTLNGIGIAHERRGEPEAALSRYEEALGLASARGLEDLVVCVQGNMVVSYALLGQLDRAVVVGERTAAISAAAADHPHHATAALNLSVAHCLRGDLSDALRCADQALGLSREAGDWMRMCEGLVIRSEANRRYGRPREALVDAERALSVAKVAGYRYAAAAAERQRSRALAAVGRDAEAAATEARARNAFAGLADAFRDPMIELILAA